MDNPEDFPKEKLQEIYEILPEDLKEAIFSEEISATINDIGVENSLNEKQNSKLIEYVGYVFLGLLSPNDFEKNIKEKLFLTEALAHRIYQQIVRTVFIPLKTSLELIHKTQINMPSAVKEKEEKEQKKVAEKTETIKNRFPVQEEEMPVQEKPPIKEESPAEEFKKDVYREPIQ